MNPVDLILLLLIVLVVVLAVRKIISDRKRGKRCSSCGGDCSCCSRTVIQHPKDKC